MLGVKIRKTAFRGSYTKDKGRLREQPPIFDKSNIKSKLKIADIDPRKEEVKNSFTISDKARTIAGGVLEAILYMKQKHEDR